MATSTGTRVEVMLRVAAQDLSDLSSVLWVRVSDALRTCDYRIIGYPNELSISL